MRKISEVGSRLYHSFCVYLISLERLPYAHYGQPIFFAKSESNGFLSRIVGFSFCFDKKGVCSLSKKGGYIGFGSVGCTTFCFKIGVLN